MHFRLWLAAALAVTPVLALSPAAFPARRTLGCVTLDPMFRYNQRLFTSLMRRKDKNASHMLDIYKVSRVKARDIRSVSEPVLCARAAVAYGKVFNDDISNRQVHILRVGDRYIVSDPDYEVDGERRAVTFDSTFSTPLAVVRE